MNRLAITRVVLKEKSNKKHLAYIMLDEKREFMDFQVFDEEETILNNIYVARVENIVTNINAAFVRITPNQMCYLSLEDLKAPIYVKKQSERKSLSIGDAIVVQVIKDAVKTKDPVVSTKLSMAGKYCMLTTENTSLGISKKITGSDHIHMSELISSYISKGAEYGFGLIVRTNALEATEEELKADIESVIESFIILKEKAIHQCAFACLYKPENVYVQKLKSLDLNGLDGIFTDETDIYEDIKVKLPYLADKGHLQLYKDDKVGLATLYNFRGSLDKLVEKRVWLKSGANIIIEQLETLTVIDVNSGKNIGKSEQAILEINKEAAVEIAKQLRLRNISGMIIVDFVNMSSKDAENELLATFKHAVAKDSVPTQVLDITRLGLVEVTRKKVNKSLIEMI
ncbi:MAG: ribonuclease E/G [Lachnospiraceae bacterium]|nr:ribonuclease E/G [Lachnospiraceae bacterium]